MAILFDQEQNDNGQIVSSRLKAVADKVSIRENTLEKTLGTLDSSGTIGLQVIRVLVRQQ